MNEPILTLDEAAAAKLQTMKNAGRFDDSALRVTVSEDGAAFHGPVGEDAVGGPREAVEAIEPRCHHTVAEID